MASLSIGKAWDEARDIIARDGQLMFTVALALIVIPGTLVALVAPGQAPFSRVEDAIEPSGFALFASFVAAIIAQIGSLAIMYLALARGASVGEAINRGAKRFLPLLGANLLWAVPFTLIVLIGLGATLGMETVEALASYDGSAAPPISGAAVLWVLIVMIAGVFFAIRFLLVGAAAVAEDRGPISLLRRSWALTRGHFWKLFGFLLLIGIGVGVLLIVVGMMAGMAVTLAFGNPTEFSVSALLMGLISAVAQALVTIVSAAIVARIYAQLAAETGVPDVDAG